MGLVRDDGIHTFETLLTQPTATTFADAAAAAAAAASGNSRILFLLYQQRY
jgi:hypothetical protein